ncbi:heparan-alpha-glucosaminide N-acetyltransferase-like [Fopius arisanus]|uniref:Heparan-alpha-glucosaminide N-acetyltransferase-like n=1 Tax=Fopius arisanus TaxID=64838 RepID=A0A9R1U126_9HYME|nr:PREDICTED: heparan-alpha-glucosaminide N-acetyltransferase-like [Fopius arisanus]
MLGKMNDHCTNPNKTLGLDEACVSVINDYNTSVSLYSFFNECNACLNQLWANVSANSNTTLSVSTKWPLHMYYVQNKLQWCHNTYRFVEHGHYGWNISRGSICSSIYTIEEPTNPYLPILTVFIILTISAFVNVTTKCFIIFVRGFLSRSTGADRDDTESLNSSGQTENGPGVIRVTRASTRIKTIDAFRGIAVLLMIFVNNGGGEYVFFKHAPWFGLTVADLVLPWFAWIMGLTIVLSLKSDLRLSISRSRIIWKFFRRSLILILLGLIINGRSTTKLQDLRFTGVLQLLGVTYFICASIETIGMKSQRNYQYGRFAFLQDILDAWPQWLIVLGLTATHLLITFLLPVSGCPRGYLGPGGNEYGGQYANCTGGAAGYIDRTVFGNHMYMKTHSPVYGIVAPHDPEGILNTLSAVLIVQFGVQAGRILFCYYLGNASKIIRWCCWATFTGIAALFCYWSKGGGIPLSKNLMSLPFVLATCSCAFILFALLYYFIDHRRFWDGVPFSYAGTNALFLYVGHYFTMKSFPWAWQLDNPSHASALAMNIWTTTLWAFIAFLLYRKDIIITV